MLMILLRRLLCRYCLWLTEFSQKAHRFTHLTLGLDMSSVSFDTTAREKARIVVEVALPKPARVLRSPLVEIFMMEL